MPKHKVVFHVESDILSTVLEVNKHPGVELVDCALLAENNGHKPHTKHRLPGKKRSVDVLLGAIRGAHPQGQTRRSLEKLFDSLSLAKGSLGGRLHELSGAGLITPDGAGGWKVTEKGRTTDFKYRK